LQAWLITAIALPARATPTVRTINKGYSSQPRCG
jgi:hypothetical protein